MAKEELLTTTQVAKELNLHINTIWRYILTGRITAFKLSGTRWRIRRTDLESFIEAGEEHGRHAENICKSSALVAPPASTSSKAVIGAGGEQRETRIHKCKSSAQAAPPAPTSREGE